jgi:hypothetical protein
MKCSRLSTRHREKENAFILLSQDGYTDIIQKMAELDKALKLALDLNDISAD